MREVILRPVALAYEGITTLRNYLYDKNVLRSEKAELPIICVGNLTVGGSAKTPLSIYLCMQLKGRGYAPVVVTRGYGGRISGPHLIGAEDTAEIAGDEPLMISSKAQVPVVVARDRAAGAKFVSERKLGDCIVLDDGLQHRRLKRDLNILSINVGSEKAIEDFRRAKLLPLGPFRENRDKALHRIQIAVFSERKTTPPPESRHELAALLPPEIKIFRSYFKAKGVYAIDSLVQLKPCKAAAFCGIANPQGFFESLRSEGFELMGGEVYSDHFKFRSSHLERLRRDFPGLPLICTEKDAVRLQGLDCGSICRFETDLEVVNGEGLLNAVMAVMQ
ncbi:MAG: tetraacyldisaccharide 4'-kinase [Proteobacteria bacterium]|nr:MAG: tetraacyldisaccharide 4'-kinase [Pseudomonadota bacterium]